MTDRTDEHPISTPTEPSGGREAVVCGAWGLLEAVCFFVVPDVAITWFAMASWRRGLRACGWAIAGAVLGGLVVWSIGRAGGADGVFRVYDHLPAVSPAMIDDVRTTVAAEGVGPMIPAAIRGVPFKLYALAAGEAGTHPVWFIVIATLARGWRFLLTATLAWAGARLFREPHRRRAYVVWAAVWIVVYVHRWTTFPN